MEITVETADTLEALIAKLRDDGAASFVTLHGNANKAAGALSEVSGLATAIMGATSCNGIMSDQGLSSGFGAFVIRDPDGDYGCAVCAFEEAPQDAAASATRTALSNAGRLGEKPELVWVASTPGVEEAVLDGIESVVGGDVPIIGGSAADNTVAGDWYVFAGDARANSGVAIAVLFPSVPISFAYQNGYAPTGQRGTVTAAKGRQILEINHRPAREVYAEWTEGAAVSKDPTIAGMVDPILSDSTLWPLGREIGDVGGVPYFLLAHPASALPDGPLELFASVSEGEALTQMTGSIDGLVSRAGRVARLALRAGDAALGAPSGALMVYCGGCRLSVEDRLEDVVAGVQNEFSDTPFLGVFTFGEQGPILGQGNRHGNLMISCIVFGSQ